MLSFGFRHPRSYYRKTVFLRILETSLCQTLTHSINFCVQYVFSHWYDYKKVPISVKVNKRVVVSKTHNRG